MSRLLPVRRFGVISGLNWRVLTETELALLISE
jgi:hypothetical protein